MAIYDILSNRGKPLPDPFIYDLPDKLRAQLAYICRHDVGRGSPNYPLSQMVAEALMREHGLDGLPDTDLSLGDETDYLPGCMHVIRHSGTDIALDCLELILLGLDKGLRNDGWFRDRFPDPKHTIFEVNYRLRAAGVGFKYENEKLLRVDSELIQAEVVKPALRLLARSEFEAANSEFRDAHTHWRTARYEDAIVNACKAFESVAKIVLSAHGADFDKNAPAAKLISALLANGIVPQYLQDHLCGLDKCLQGVATVRNKEGAHGAGELRETPEHVAAYALHLAAANIVFVVESHLAAKK